MVPVRQLISTSTSYTATFLLSNTEHLNNYKRQFCLWFTFQMLPTLPKCQYVRRTKNFVDNYLLVCANIKTVNFIECNVLRRKMSLWMESVFSRNVNWQLPAQCVLDLTRLQAMSLNVRHPWFKTSLNDTVRVFGECYPNNLWFKDSENSSELMGLGPAILKVRVF